MPDVIVYVDSNGTHLHQIYSGLFLLYDKGEIDIKFRPGKNVTGKRPNRQFLLIDVRPDGSSCYYRCLFDMQDSKSLGLESKLPDVDFYFKRSFSSDWVIGTRFEEKIFPYGLNYQAILPRGNRIFSRVILEYVSRPFNFFSKKNRFHVDNILDLVRHDFFGKNNNLVSYDEIDRPEILVDKKRILFQCRLWEEQAQSVDKIKDLRNLNRDRVDLIESLKYEFGDRFVGGLQPTKEARTYFPDLITDVRSKRRPYIETMKSSDIVISSPGLLDSMGWKFAEYVAAGKCIVTSPVSSVLPGRFKENENYLEYGSVAECISACRRLINDPELAYKISKNNKKYYAEYVRPDSIIRNCINLVRARNLN